MLSFQAQTVVDHPDTKIVGINSKSAMEMTVDDVADIAAIVRLAIVAVQSVEDMHDNIDPATLASVITSLSMADRLLCRLHHRCDNLGMRETGAYRGK